MADRRRTVAVAGAVAVVLLGGLAVLLAPSLLVRVAPASLRFDEPGLATAVDGFGGPAGTYVVGYEHDAYLGVGIRVANRGPVALHVHGVRLASQAAPLLVPAGTGDPVTVAPGEVAWVEVDHRFDNCEAYHEREAMLVDEVELMVEVLGRTRVEAVPLDRSLMARSPMLWQCPDRTVDREDDRRGG